MSATSGETGRTRTRAEHIAMSLAKVSPDRSPHSWPESLVAGEWWACERPESPATDGIWWDEKCQGCRLAYEAHQRQQPTFGVWFKGQLTPIPEVPIDAFVDSHATDSGTSGNSQ